MHDAILLAVLSDKDNLKKYRRFVKDYSIQQETKLLLGDFEKYFESYPTYTTIDISAFTTWFTTVRHPGMKKEKLQLFSKILETIQKEQEDPKRVTETVIEYFIKLDYTQRIAHEAEQVILGTETELIKIKELLEDYETNHSLAVLSEDPFITTDLDELVKETLTGPGLDWRLDCLNQILGPVRKGDFIVLAARPETGKTTLLCSEVTYMAPQLEKDQIVLWVSNEEGGNKIQFRAFQAALGEERATILKDIPAAKKRLEGLLGTSDKVRVYHNPYTHYKDIDSLCAKYNPGLIILDQIDKIAGFDGERDDIRLQKLYQWAREKAKVYGPVVAVCQADGSADGVRYISMHQLAGSKTGKQGEADAIITIGFDYDPAYEFLRFINVPKNKLIGGSASLESMRHGKAEVNIHPSIARYSAV